MKGKLTLFILSSFISLLTACFGTGSTEDATSNSIFENQTFKLRSIEDLTAFLTYNEQSPPIISAHRGGAMPGFPENAIETFDNIAKKIPAIIECDVRLTKDSIMVLIHDETLDRTTTGKGLVNKHTLQELQKLYLKDTKGNLTDFKIPTLEEALIWGKGKAIFSLDIKKGVAYQDVSSLIEKVKAIAYTIPITYTSSQAAALHQLNPDLMISVKIRNLDDLKRTYQAGIPDNKIVAFVGTNQPQEDLVKALHDHGIKIILGTMGNLDRQAEAKGDQMYAKYIEQGADIISTDRPFEAFKALEYYIRKRNLSSPYITD